MSDGPCDAAALLRTRLRNLGWTQLDLASAIDVSPAIVSRWLSGDRTPSLDMAFRIQRSEVGLPADAWVSHSADESGEHPAVEAEPRKSSA
jgi:transcriptional regulator with XRE-family HTH domain